MRFSTIPCALAFIASVAAQTPGFNPITKPGQDETIEAGTTYKIEWQSTKEGKVSLALIGGASTTSLSKLATIATGLDSTALSYSWTIDASLGSAAFYGINMTLDSDPDNTFQYSTRFYIKGGDSVISNSTSSASQSASPSSYMTSASASSYTNATSTKTSAVQTLTTTTSPSITSAPGTSTRASTTAAPSSTVSTAGAYHAAAGSMAVIGGIAAAVFAL